MKTLLIIAITLLYTPTFAFANDCHENIAKQVLKAADKTNDGCKVQISTSTFGVGFGAVGEADVNCPVNADASIVETLRYSFHLEPGSTCILAGAQPISAPIPALAVPESEKNK